MTYKIHSNSRIAAASREKWFKLMRRIWNPVEHLRWSFFAKIVAKSRYFLKKSPS